jgi:hypothetical protein
MVAFTIDTDGRTSDVKVVEARNRARIRSCRHGCGRALSFHAGNEGWLGGREHASSRRSSSISDKVTRGIKNGADMRRFFCAYERSHLISRSSRDRARCLARLFLVWLPLRPWQSLSTRPSPHAASRAAVEHHRHQSARNRAGRIPQGDDAERDTSERSRSWCDSRRPRPRDKISVSPAYS